MSFLIDHENTLPKNYAIQKCITFGKHVQDYCFITLDVPSSIVSVPISSSCLIIFCFFLIKIKSIFQFVCSLFWLIQTFNRPLFFPSEMSTWIPDWYNHAVHTNPFFVIFFLMFFHFHRNPPVKPAVFGLCLHSSAYIAW